MKKICAGKMTGKIKLQSLIFFVLIALVAGLWLPDADAAQIKRVQSGEVYFDAAATTQTAEIQSVDKNKTLVFLYPKPDVNTSANARQNILFSADFGSSTDLVISRDGASYGVTVRYYLVEFVDGVNVYRGISSFAAGSNTNAKYTTKTISLSPSLTDYNNAVAMVNTRCSLTTATNDEMATVRVTIPDNNTLVLDRYATNEVLKSVNLVWQVAEFTRDATVKHGTATIAINSLTGTATISPEIGTLGKALLLFSYKANTSVNGVEGREDVSGQITNATTVTFTRGYQNNTALTNIEVSWFVVEFTDSLSSVQGQSAGVLSVASGTEAVSITLGTAIDPTRSVPIFTVSGPLSQTASTYEDENRFSIERDSPHGLVYVPGTPGEVWVTNYYSNTVTRYNASTGAQVGSPITVGSGPNAICYLSSTSPATVWVANYISDNVTKIDTSTYATTNYALPAGAAPIDICADPSTSSAWTANNGFTDATTNISKITAVISKLKVHCF